MQEERRVSEGDGESLSAEYGRVVEGVRGFFKAGRSKDIAWRRRQLEQIHKMCAENHEAMTAAVRADLGGSKMRGVGEITCVDDARHALANLEKWATPQQVANGDTVGLFGKSYVRAEPKGVVLIIAPWNFPFSMCFQPLVPAIAAGNCAIIKPSEMSPNCADLIESLVSRYLDADCIRVIKGEIPETTALLQQRWDHIFYTGNGAVGRKILQAAAAHLTPVTLELGGKSPVIIDQSAQMEATVQRIALAKWTNVGQICVAPDYVLVHESREQEFVQQLKAATVKSFGEDPRKSVDWGRIIQARHVDRLKRLIESSGGEVYSGGAETIDRSDRYVPPTIIRKPKLESPIMQEEIFGPLLAVQTFKDLDEAIDIVNSKERPLALYVYSQCGKNAEKIFSRVPSGGACLNTSLEHLMSHNIPFGGTGASGMGCYHGKFGFDEFSHKRGMVYKTTLPLLRSAAVPPPPLPDFVYGLAIKYMLGVPPRMKSAMKVVLLLLVAAFLRRRLR